MENSIFIQVLEYGEKVGLEGTSYSNFQKWAEREGFIDLKSDKPKDSLQVISLSKLFTECFETSSLIDNERSAHSSDVLKTEYYFRLIEHRELQESRTAARSANKNAMLAICISVAAIIVSAVLTFTQLNTPATINKSDLQALINFNAVQREVKLDSLQMTQILSAVGYDKTKPTVKKQKALPEGKEISHSELINKYYEEE